jgi:hypothetical protein
VDGANDGPVFGHGSKGNKALFATRGWNSDGRPPGRPHSSPVPQPE